MNRAQLIRAATGKDGKAAESGMDLKAYAEASGKVRKTLSNKVMAWSAHSKKSLIRQRGLELFGPDYEVAVEMVPFQGEWSLLRALHMENAVTRNKVMHTHEVVAQLTRWWDDVVFEKYPTYGKARLACKNNELSKVAGEKTSNFMKLVDFEEYFSNEGRYEESVKYGIGREVLSKMLEGTETRTAIEQALASFACFGVMESPAALVNAAHQL